MRGKEGGVGDSRRERERGIPGSKLTVDISPLPLNLLRCLGSK